MRKTEHMLFQFPTNPEMFLACIAVLQAYVEELRTGSLNGTPRNIEPVLHCAVDQLWNLRFLQLTLDCQIVASPFDLAPEAYEQFELVHSFDGWHALQMCTKVDKHATQALGILLGAEVKSLPDLTMLWADKAELPSILITSEELPKLEEYCLNAGWIVTTYKPDIGIEARLYAAMCAHVVVGLRGPETYAAAAAGRYVLELYPAEDYPKQWLSKWACRTYRMIYGTREKLTSEMAWRSLDLLLKKKIQEERAEKWRLTRRPERGILHTTAPTPNA